MFRYVFRFVTSTLCVVCWCAVGSYGDLSLYEAVLGENICQFAISSFTFSSSVYLRFIIC